MEIPGYILLIIIMVAWRSVILSQLWEWFIVPLGAPAIGIAHAYGIVLVASLLTNQVDTAKDKNLPAWMVTAIQMGVALVFLGLGWAVRFFM